MDKKYTVETFDSINQLLSTIEARPANTVFANADKSSESGAKSFTGTGSYKEARDLLTNGWEEPLAQLKATMRQMGVKSNVTRQKARPSINVVGYAPHVPNAILGLPQSMIMTEKQPSKVKAVNIIYNTNGCAGTKREQFLKSGVAVLKIIQNLELSGYRVALTVEFFSGRVNIEDAIGRVKIKDWREHIDLKKLCFPFAHASMLRRIGFKWVEGTPGLQRDFTYGYGKSIGDVDDYEKVVKDFTAAGLLDEKSFYINMQMAEKEQYDAERIMRRAGMKELAKEVA